MSDNLKEVITNFLVALSVIAVVAAVVAGVAYINHDANMSRKHFIDSCYASGGHVVMEETSKDVFVKQCKPPN